jgi:DNA-binding GntR family transcriptional regulator
MDSFVQLSEEVVNRLLKEIKYGKYAGLLKHSSEVKMAEEMGVSLSVIRDSLSVLEQEGFVIRKHGVGTIIINKHVLNVVKRIDLEKEFMGTISDAGYTPDVAFAKAQIVKANETFAKKLVTADGKPAIYCVDYIPKMLDTPKKIYKIRPSHIRFNEGLFYLKIHYLSLNRKYFNLHTFGNSCHMTIVCSAAASQNF